MRNRIFILTLAAVAISGHASEAPSNATRTGAAIDPVFDCYRANSAWGFTLTGKVIDSHGKIWSYGKHGKAWLPTLVKEGDATYLTPADLQGKFTEAKETGSVDEQALNENSALIAKAAQGKLTQTDGGARDAGTSACHAYIHDDAKQRYRDVELGSDAGVNDTRVTNSAPEAQTLLVWLKSVGAAK
jgi:hypothetical protein